MANDLVFNLKVTTMTVYFWFMFSTLAVSERWKTAHICGNGTSICYGRLYCSQDAIILKEFSFSALKTLNCNFDCQFGYGDEILVDLFTFSTKVFETCSLKSSCDLNGHHDIKELPDSKWRSEVKYSCIGSEDPVIDICRNSQVLVHGYGHIVYWPSQKTNSSCVCHFHEATSVTVKAFSPLHKRKRSTCSSSIYINNENVPCETDGLKRQSANKITLTAPGNDRLWAEIQGNNVTVSCQTTKKLASSTSLSVTTTKSEQIITTYKEFSLRTNSSSNTDISIPSTMSTQPVVNQGSNVSVRYTHFRHSNTSSRTLTTSTTTTSVINRTVKGSRTTTLDATKLKSATLYTQLFTNSTFMTSQKTPFVRQGTHVSVKYTHPRYFDFSRTQTTSTTTTSAIDTTVERPTTTTLDTTKLKSATSYTQLLTNSTFMTSQKSSFVTKEPQRDRSKMNLVLPIAVGGVAILVVGFLIVAFAILRKRRSIEKETNNKQDMCSYRNNTYDNSEAQNINEYETIHDGFEMIDAVKVESRRSVNGKATESGLAENQFKENNEYKMTDKRTDGKDTCSEMYSDNTYNTSCLTKAKLPKPDDATYSHLEKIDYTYNTTSPSTRQDGISRINDTYAHFDESKHIYNSSVGFSKTSADIDPTYSHLKQ